MPLNANALTTLDATKTYLKIELIDTSEDALFESLINAVSDQIENYCRRKLRERTYTDEEYDGTDNCNLLLSQFPVSSVSDVKIDDVSIDPSEYKIRKDTGILVRTNSRWPEGVMNIKVTHVSGYNPVPSDLELACKHMVMFYYKTDISNFSKTFGEGFMIRPEAFPPQVRMLLDGYRKAMI
jgi:uncharacterized phiE125 gp8 family phage protein